jgi:hypothetical protein
MTNFSALLVGPPGAGKTTAAATAPSPVLFLDMDNKLHKMDNLQEKIKSGQIVQWTPDERLFKGKLSAFVQGATNPQAKFTQQRAKGYQKLAEVIDELEEKGGVYNGKMFNTIVLDSFTSVEEHLKRLLMSANGVTTISQPLWGTVLTNYENLLNSLLNLKGVNIIIIAHQKPNKDELTGVITYTPLISGQMKDKIGKDFEEVYYLEKTIKGDKAVYEMLTVGNTQKQCRTSKQLEARVEPDFSKIYK